MDAQRLRASDMAPPSTIPRKRIPSQDDAVMQSRPRVVILGAGFGGLAAAIALRNAAVDITVIDRRNYHLFQPLLYQVATAGLSPAQIASPIRGILRNQRNVTVLMEKVEDIDRDRRAVITADRHVPFDFLIVATGARHAYFGHDEWEPFAPGLKKVEDATTIRRNVLTAFETAESTDDAAAHRRLLTFAIIGGGPTGVEMAGAIAELAKKALARDFRRIDPKSARILLVEAGPRILPTFPEALSTKAQRQLERLGVEVHLGRPVTQCDSRGLVIGGETRVEASTLVWGAGVAASPAARWLKAEKDRVGRVIVGPTLHLDGDPTIFVIGDTAAAKNPDGRPVPGVAPAAKQMGMYVAEVIRRRLKDRAPPAPFRYRDYGNLATIGRKAAIADFGRLRLSGFPAWLTWSLAHVYFLIGFRNRVGIMLDWTWAYLTFDRGARLITGGM